ncbi:MAG: phosphopantetheine-binding protein [Rhodospirillaceae bacterium]
MPAKMDNIELGLKRLIIEALKLEDITPEEIGSEEPLFGDLGLGLDSIDALELGVAIRKAYGIKIESVTDEIKTHFLSVRSLAAFITARRME